MHSRNISLLILLISSFLGFSFSALNIFQKKKNSLSTQNNKINILRQPSAIIGEDDRKDIKRYGRSEFEALMRLVCDNGIEKKTCTAGLIASDDKIKSSDIILTAGSCIKNINLDDCVLEYDEEEKYSLVNFFIAKTGWALIQTNKVIDKKPFLVTSKTRWKRNFRDGLKKYCSDAPLTVNLMSYEKKPQIQHDCKILQESEFNQINDCDHNSLGSLLFYYEGGRIFIAGINSDLEGLNYNKSINFINDKYFLRIIKEIF